MLDILVGFFSDYGYIAVFAILILCGFGLPVPEDITLVSGGVIAGLDLANPHWMLAVGLAGVLIGDSTMFLAGRIFGYRIQRIKTFRKILSPRRFSQIQRKFKKYGLGLLFVARFLPGLRSPIFLVAGMSRRINYFTFIAMDGVAALISVPVWVYLGYFFADNLDLLMEYVSDVQRAIYLVLGLLVVVVLVIYFKKKFHAKLNRTMGEEHADSAVSAPSADSVQGGAAGVEPAKAASSEAQAPAAEKTDAPKPAAPEEKAAPGEPGSQPEKETGAPSTAEKPESAAQEKPQPEPGKP